MAQSSCNCWNVLFLIQSRYTYIAVLRFYFVLQKFVIISIKETSVNIHIALIFGYALLQTKQIYTSINGIPVVTALLGVVPSVVVFIPA